MSNLPPNPYNIAPGAQQGNANPVAPAINHSQQFGQVPLNQLPPGYGGMKQDANSNSPYHTPTSAPQNHALTNVNNYNQSGNSSPAFNQPGIGPPYAGIQSSPLKSPPASKSSIQSNVSSASGSPSPYNANPSPTPYSQNALPPQRQINDNAPPLVPSTQFNQPSFNGPSNPPMSIYPGSMTSNLFPATSASYNTSPISKPSDPLPGGSNIPFNPSFGPPASQLTGPMTSQPYTPYSAPLAGPPRNSPLMHGAPISGPPLHGPSGPTGPPLGPSGSMSLNGPSLPPVSGAFVPPKPLASGLPQASKPGPYMNGPTMSGPPISGPAMSSQSISGAGQPISRQPMTGPPGPLTTLPSLSGRPISGPLSGPSINRPPMPGTSSQPFPGQPRNGPPGPFGPPSGPQSLPAQFPPRPPHPQPPTGHQMGPPGPSQGMPSVPSQPPTGPMNGPPKTNMQNRYPQMQPGGYNQPPQPMGQYPQQYNTQNMTQQMGNLSVTKQGFDQLWGHQTVDLMQCKHILPEYPEELPEIKLGPAFPDAVNCSPE